MSHEEECAELTTIIEKLGADAARRVMLRTTTLLLEPDDMVILVDAECDRFRAFFDKRGAIPGDVLIAHGVFRQALVSEGKRIAITVDWEGGSA